MKRLLALLLALLLSLSLAGCWTEEEEQEDFWLLPEETALPENEAAPVFTSFALPYVAAQTLDPIRASAVQQPVCALLYEGLFSLDRTFAPRETLCASYTCDDTATVYTFTLRSGITFSDGSLLSASDVLASYRRAAVSERYAARFANVASARVVSGALVVTLAAPDSAFPALLDIPIVKAGTENDAVPLGTGPYLFATDADGAYLLRNDNHPDAPPLARVGLVAVKDADAAAYYFTAQSVQLLTADLLSDSAAAALSGTDIADAPSTVLLYLGFNCSRGLCADAAVRRAMNAAVDRKAIADILLAGHAAAAQFPIHPACALYPTALESAYAEADYTGSAALHNADAPEEAELTLLVNAENSFKVSLAEHLCRQLSADGLRLTPLALPFSDYLAALESGDFDLYLGEVRLTADWDLTPLLGTEGTLNYGRFSDEALESLLAQFLAEESAETAAAFCRRFAQALPFLPVAFKSVSLLTPEGLVSGAVPTAADPFSNFSEWSLRLAEP